MNLTESADLPELREHIRSRRPALAGFMEQGCALALEADLLRVIPRNDIYIRYLNDNRASIGELASEFYGRNIRVMVEPKKINQEVAQKPEAKQADTEAEAGNTQKSLSTSVDPAEFVASIVEPGRDGWLEVRAIKNRKVILQSHCRNRRKFKTEVRGAAEQGADIYFGVAARANDKSGKLDDCQHLAALFTDIDFKMTPESAAFELLERFALKPSAIVPTGGGLHVYWLLSVAIPLPGEAARATAILRKLTVAVGGDLGAAEPARVLRIPGTQNHKYDPPRTVELRHFDPAIRYSLEEVEAAVAGIEDPRAKSTHGAASSNGTSFKTFTASQSHEPVSIEQAEEMLKYVDSDDRETWLRAAMSVKNEFGQSGRPLWDVYSQRSAKYDPADQEKTWNSIDGDGGITIATLIMEAKRGGWAPPGARNARGDSGNADGTYRGDGEGAGHSGNASAEQGTPRTPWPAALDEAASHGPAGEFVKLVLPHTEADPAALLIQFLVAIGCIIGRKLYRIAEAAEHYPNFFVCTVGKTGHGRKGSAWAQVARLLRLLTSDAPDIGVPIQSGLTSGEGLIYAVRDAVERTEKVNEKGKPTAYQTVQVDDGVSDKRLLVVETEFAKVLRIAERDGNVLSPVIRRAWDTGDLQTLSKNSPLKATGAHVSIVGHITEEELLRCLTSTEAANGGANRYLWHCAKRSKFLPRGGHLNDGDFGRLVVILKAVFEWAGAPREMGMSEAAWQIWEEVYEELSSGRPGLLGALLSRAEAQVLRLSILYAALDRAGQIEPAHLKAALAVWEYCEASVEYIFGDQLGDPDADAILSALRTNEDGLSRTDIRDIFARNLSAGRIERALDVLRRANLATVTRATTGGRPAEIWRAVVTTKTTKTTKGGYSTGAA